MGAFRFFFMPEFGGFLGEVRGTGRRMAGYVAALAPRGGAVRPGLLLLPAGRATGVVASLLVAIGAVAVFEGIAGLREAAGQSVDPDLFAAEDAGTRKLLGFLGDFGDSGSPVLGQMLGMFNGGIFILAGFLLAWQVVTGAFDTAREGRWGWGGWEILRIAIAVALMAPIPGLGASGAQHIVLGLARLGGDFANVVWEPLAVETLGKGRAVVPWPREMAWRSVIGRTLVSEVCMYVANGEARMARDDPYVVVRAAKEWRVGDGWIEEPRGGSGRRAAVRRFERKIARARNPVAAEARHYDGAGSGMPKDLCGAIRFVGVNEDGSRGIAAKGHREAWRAAHPQIVRAAASIGDRYLQGSASAGQPLPNVSDELDGLGVAETYRAVMELHVKQSGTEEQRALTEAVAKDAEEISWVAAASFINTLAASAARIQSAAANVPQASLFSPEVGEWSPKAKAASQAMVRALAQDQRFRAVSLGPGSAVSGPLAPATGRGGNWLEWLLGFIDVEAILVADSGNPLLDLTNMGFMMLHTGMSTLGVLTGAAILSNTVGVIDSADVFQAGWDVTEGLVAPLIGLLLIAGAVLAYVVPALPFIRFLFGILTWLLAIVEAMLAVTVFCAAHIRRGEGNRLALAETRQGWLFLPALVLRPVLMLFGLVLGYYVFLAVMGMFNEVWLPRMADTIAARGESIVDFIAMLALYVMVAYGLVNAAFKLIDMLPAAVLGWIGGQAGGDPGGEGVLGVATGGFGRAGGFRAPGRFGTRGRGGTMSGAPPGGGNPAGGGS